jgi:hypothetical protein
LQCRNCGEVVDPRRVELGYDYCMKEVCQQRCIERVQLAAVGVNKAADYYMKAEEVLPPRPPGPGETGPAAATGVEAEAAEDPAEAAEVAVGAGLRAVEAPGAAWRTRLYEASKTKRRPKTTLERLREHEAALDGALERSYERFRRGEITATELHAERDRMIGAFNRLVMRENIRYRSMLRGPAHRAG